MPGAANVNCSVDIDPVAVAASLRPLLMKHADQAEAERRIPDPVMAALRDSGLFYITAPRRAGGPGHTLTTHIETVAEVAKGCVGSAWAYCLLSGITGTIAAFPPEVQAMLFRTGDELFCSATGKTAHADPVDGGYRVTGRWGYGSGSPHADWGLNGLIFRTASGDVDEIGLGFIDLTDPAVHLKDDWDVVGMSGSGSNTIVADGVFVPEALVLRPSRMPPPEAVYAIPGLEPRDYWPMEPIFPLGVLPPMLGAASAMLEAVSGAMDTRAVVGWHYAKQQDSQRYVHELGQAALEIDGAWMHIRRAAGMLDAVAPKRLLTGFEKARIQADCGRAMGLVRGAGQRLMDIAGPGAFARANPLQRYWRDLNVGTRHNALNSGLSAELYGRALLGLESSLELLPDIGPAPESDAP